MSNTSYNQNNDDPRTYKGFSCLRDSEYSFWRILEAPLELSGFFTTISVLEKAIDEFMVRQTMKEDGEIPSILRTSDHVLVRIQHSEEQAVIDAADFDALMERGISKDWYRNPASYMRVAVRIKGEQTLTPVARLITQARDGTKVLSIDRNPLNLRRSNLLLSTSGRLPNNIKEKELQ
jgi:hypothetical protein